MRRGRGRVADVGRGVLAALLIFAGVPAGLGLATTWAVVSVFAQPGAGASPISAGNWFVALVAVGWVSWAVCSWQIVRATAARIRAVRAAMESGCRRPHPGRQPGRRRLVEGLATRIAAAILALAPVPLSGTASAATAAPVAAAPAFVPPHSSPRTPPVRDGARRPGGPSTEPRALAPADAGPAPVVPLEPPAAPWLGAIGAGAMLAALLARRARRNRSLRLGAGDPPDDPADPADDPAGATRASVRPTARVGDDDLADLASWIDLWAGSPLACIVEAADRRLAEDLQRCGHEEDAPAVLLVRVSKRSVDVWLAEPTSWQPPGWQSIGGGRIWRLASGATPDPRPGDAAAAPWLPVLLPLGEDRSGSWLVPLEPSSCLCVLGTAGQELVAAMSSGAQAWDWAELLTVTADPQEAELVATLAGHPRSQGATRIVYVGQPSDLSEAARSRCSVVTNVATDRAQLTVVVDRRVATVHPLGITVRPNLLSQERRSQVDAVVDGPAASSVPPCAPPPGGGGGLAAAGPAAADTRAAEPAAADTRAAEPAAADTRAAEPAAADPAAADPAPSGPHSSTGATGAPGARTVLVRVLTAVPRIDGLAEPLPGKRARRAVELVAYLALHHPDPVTSDRLRTRVLGSADVDASAKTLFNVVAAARRSLGLGPDGAPLFPPGGKLGHYHLSPTVDLDARRALALISCASSQPDPAARIGLLREALSLIEGEPLSGVCHFGWWQGEGHAARVADAIVDGACQLAEAASEAGLPQLAAWAIERARLVQPYSEALSRAAMRAAAAHGDADRLRREWNECQRQIEEIDPGGYPSERTERLYLELSQSVSPPTR